MTGAPEPPWWRTRDEPGRGERRPLTRDAIVEAALHAARPRGAVRAEHAQAGPGARRRRRLAVLARGQQGGAARACCWTGSSARATRPSPTRPTGRSRSSRWRATPAACCSSHRDAAQISLGRIPVGPRSMPVLERYLAVLARGRAARARDRPRRGHVRALRRRLRLRGEHAGAAARGRERLHRAARRVLPLAAPGRVPDARAASPTTSPRATPTSASSSPSSCWCAGWRRWRGRVTPAARLISRRDCHARTTTGTRPEGRRTSRSCARSTTPSTRATSRPRCPSSRRTPSSTSGARPRVIGRPDPYRGPRRAARVLRRRRADLGRAHDPRRGLPRDPGLGDRDGARHRAAAGRAGGSARGLDMEGQRRQGHARAGRGHGGAPVTVWSSGPRSATGTATSAGSRGARTSGSRRRCPAARRS